MFDINRIKYINDMLKRLKEEKHTDMLSLYKSMMNIWEEKINIYQLQEDFQKKYDWKRFLFNADEWLHIFLSSDHWWVMSRIRVYWKLNMNYAEKFIRDFCQYSYENKRENFMKISRRERNDNFILWSKYDDIHFNLNYLEKNKDIFEENIMFLPNYKLWHITLEPLMFSFNSWLAECLIDFFKTDIEPTIYNLYDFLGVYMVDNPKTYKHFDEWDKYLIPKTIKDFIEGVNPMASNWIVFNYTNEQFKIDKKV